ncbi:MAG: carboxypeptidase-like regulatory domain-containing protein [Planctomycetota bacterium]
MPNLFAHCLASPLIVAIAAQDPRPFEVLNGTVTDDQGNPLAGVAVEFHRRFGQGFHCLDLANTWVTERVAVTRTGKRGSFAVQLPRGVPFELRIDDGVHAIHRNREVYAGEELAVRLGAPARLEVRLHDPDGKPCAATITVWYDDRLTLPKAATDPDGRWLGDRLPAGTLSVEIEPQRGRQPGWEKVELVAGETKVHEVVIQPGHVLRGRITDAKTGAPIAGARIGEGWVQHKAVVSDAEGRYLLPGYGAEGYGNVRVTAAGYGAAIREVSTSDEEPTMDIALERGFTATGRIVDAHGQPVRNAYVAAVGGVFSSGDTHDWSSARTDAEGRYVLTALRRQHPHTLMVRMEGAATLIGDMPPPGLGDARLPDVALRPARYVSGVVVDAAGAPLPGIEVELTGANADRTTLLGPGPTQGSASANYCIASRSMRSDSKGRIHFADVPPGRYQLQFDGDHADRSWPVEVEADKDPEPVRMEK